MRKVDLAINIIKRALCAMFTLIFTNSVRSNVFVCARKKRETFLQNLKVLLGLLNESHPRVFQTITLSFFIAFKARQG